MPLLDADSSGSATHICAECGQEQRVTRGRWILDDTDPSVFTSPRCRSGIHQETLFWHDAVFVSTRTRTVPVKDDKGNPRKVFHHSRGKVVEVTQTETETFADPEHFGAEQTVLIGRVARALGRKQAARANNGERRYSRAPQAPDPDKVRQAVGAQRANPA